MAENDWETFSDGTNTYSYKEVRLLLHSPQSTSNHNQNMKLSTLYVQMFLTSEALDICAQFCLKPPFPTKSDLQAFGHLLTACLPSSVLNEQVQALLTGIEHLGLVTATFGGKSDLEKQAQQAVCAAIACLKEPQASHLPGFWLQQWLQRATNCCMLFLFVSTHVILNACLVCVPHFCT